MFFFGCYKDNYFSLFLHPPSTTPPWKIRKNATGKFSRANTSPANHGLRHESIELPDGRLIPDYYVFEYPDWVNVIAITKEGKFVFIDQYRHGLGETDYEIPAGVAEPDDASMLAAAQRELAEETGYGGGQWRELMVVAPNPSTQNNLTYCYLATGVERLGEQHLDATEDIRVHLFSGAEVRELLESGRIRQALMAAPLWRYAAEYGL